MSTKAVARDFHVNFSTISCVNFVLENLAVRLRARRPHHGLDLTAVRRRIQLRWANAHLRWPLTRWEGVLFMDESWFQLYWADDRRMASCGRDVC